MKKQMAKFKYPAEAVEFFKKEGKRGGKKAAEGMTAQERTERARKAGKASAVVRARKSARGRKAK